MAIEDVLEAFKGHGLVQLGKGWRAHCPAHDDPTPSLRIDLDEGGWVLIKDKRTSKVAS